MESGVTRIVFKLGNYVIKIPNFTYSHLNFLNGCYANWSERNYFKQFKSIKVAPSLYCSIFGLIQVQKYCKPINRELTIKELEYFSDVRNGETKRQNFGFYNNKIVCVDYSN